MTKRLLVLVAVGLVALLLSLGGVATSAVSVGDVYQNVHVGPRSGGGEPSIATALDGTLYVSYPGPGMGFYSSKNNGKTWIKGGVADPNSGDTTVNVDSTGAVYQSNLNGDLEGDLFKSFDGGKTWAQKSTNNSPTNVSVLGLPDVHGSATNSPWFMDRQWVDAYVPPGKKTDEARVYFTYHDFVVGLMWVNVSKDGGKTFSDQKTIMTDPVALAHGFCNVIPGGLKVVQSGPHAGRVYIAWLAGNVATNAPTGCNITQMDTFGQLWIAWSDDEGETWNDHLVYDAGAIGHDASGLFADLALDTAGNPYTTISYNTGEAPHIGAEGDQWDVFVFASFDGGETWNGATDATGAPYQVTNTKGTHVFSAITAGDPGSVAVAYIATDAVVPQLPYGKPQPGGVPDAEWYLYLARSYDVKSGHPTWKTQKLTPKPMHKGDVCTLGLFCAVFEPFGVTGPLPVAGAPSTPLETNRDLLDFIDVVTAPNGMVHVAYTDTEISDDGAILSSNQIAGRPLKQPKKPVLRIPKPRIPKVPTKVLGEKLAGTGVRDLTAIGALMIVVAGLLVRRLRRTA
jgi:hypothetical protein